MFSIFKYFKLKKKLDSIYVEENTVSNLSALFGSSFKIDWVGRLYTVINPSVLHIDPIGSYSSPIMEFTADGRLSDTMHIEKWVMDKLNMAQDFITKNNLFELLTYRIDKIDEFDNYLFIMQPIGFDDAKREAKWIASIFCVLTIAAILAIVL